MKESLYGGATLPFILDQIKMMLRDPTIMYSITSVLLKAYYVSGLALVC